MEKESFIFKLVPFFDFDRFRKYNYTNYDKKRHSFLKRFTCWLLDEKLYPIDWEEVPPFDDYNQSNQSPTFIELYGKNCGEFHPTECVSQPDMVTSNMVLFRKFLLIFTFFGIYVFLERNQIHFYRLWLFGPTYYHSAIFKFAWLSYLYFIAEKSIVSRHHRFSYNY